MKTRLLGAAVLIALAVLFVPMLFSSNPPSTDGDKSVSLEIPAAPDRDLKTQTMSLQPGAAPAGAQAVGAASAGSAAAAPQAASKGPLIPGPNTPPPAAPARSDQLATVNIGSNRPRDVETDPQAGAKPQPTTVEAPGRSAAQPEIPAQHPSARNDNNKQAAAAPAAPPVAEAAHGSYALNLSAYASAASAQSLMGKVRALGYGVSSRTISQGGKPLTLVLAGPFDSRAAAEAARLKITQSVPGVPARLTSSASNQVGDAPAAAPRASNTAPAAAAPAAAPARAGGWAVQVAAVGSQADANALRDKLRGAGFDGFVDSVSVGGKQLWRVRVGPQTQREDAVRLRDQVKAKLGMAGNVVSL